MRSYTSVRFNRYEIQLLDKAALHLAIAFPGVREPMPRKQEERSADQQARVLFQLVRDSTQGTYANVDLSLQVVERLEATLEHEAALGYWLNQAAVDGGVRPEPSDEPTSAYHQCVVLAETRAGQLAEARRALKVLRRAAAIVTPLPDRDEDDEDDYEDHDEIPAAV